MDWIRSAHPFIQSHFQFFKTTKKQIGVRRIKLFDRDVPTLQAIQAAIPGAEVTVGLGNDELSALAADPLAAVEALRPLQPFGGMIRYVAVGSEPNEAPAWEDDAKALAQVLLPAYEHTVLALQALGGSLQGARAVVPLTMAMVDGFAKPPPHRRKQQQRHREKQESMPVPAVAEGQFSPAWDGPLLLPLLQALNASGSGMMMNLHPYGVFKDHARTMDVGFATGSSSSNSSSGSNGYTSLLDQLHDTLVTALAKAGYPEMEIVVGETGWPSAGGVGASAAHACRYVRSAVGRTARAGTPLRPGKGVELYLFEAFDEDGKTVFGGIEPHWGVLRENGQAKYPVDWVGDAGVDCG